MNVVALWSARLWDSANINEVKRLTILLLHLSLAELRDLVSGRFDNRYIIVKAEPPAEWSAPKRKLYKAMIAETMRLPEEAATPHAEIPVAWHPPEIPVPPDAAAQLKAAREQLRRGRRRGK